MAISRIRGEQIRQKVLTNLHVAENAAIEERKLDINWAGHYQGALESKKVVDFVQVGNKVVGGLAEFNLSTNGVIVGGNATTSTSTEEGVITDAPYNRVIIRDAYTGDSVIDENGEEVFGRLVHDGVDFKVLFVSVNGEEEVSFTMEEGQEIDFQYMERFNLKTVSELFAANEKFVAGAADITAFQNIEQLAKDLYGAGYTLDRDGKGNLSLSIQEQITNEVQERKDADQKIVEDLAAQAEAGKGANLVGVEDAGNRFLGGTVEAVLAEIHDALKNLEADLASTEVGKGASKIGIHDVGENFASENVEGALQELADRAKDLELGSNAEVDNAKTRDAASVNGTFEEKEFASLEDRFVEIETVVDAEAKDKEDRVSTLETGLAQEIQDRTDAIEAEKARAEAVEAGFNTRITDLESLVEEDVSDAIQVETDRAVAAEQALQTALDEEIARAKSAEEALDGRATSLEEEVEAARGSEASIDARLDRALNENGTLKAGAQIHSHYRARYQATGGEAEVLLSAFNKPNLPAFQVGDDSLEVFINGQLQEPGLNYQESPEGDKVIFDLGDGTVLEPTDIVQIKYYINNAE